MGDSLMGIAAHWGEEKEQWGNPFEARARAMQEIELEKKRREANKQKWKDDNRIFIEDVMSQQSSLDKSMIDKLNSEQPDVERVGLVTKGKINGKDVYLSINREGDLVYDIVKKGKYITIEAIKKFDDYIGCGTEVGIKLHMNGNTFRPNTMGNISKAQENYVRFLPETAVYNYSAYHDTSPVFQKKTTEFISTYLFAETDLTLTKTEWHKKEEKRRQEEEKRRQMEEKRRQMEEKRRQMEEKRKERKERKQKQKNIRTIDNFLSGTEKNNKTNVPSDTKSNWFNALLNKIRSRSNG